MSDTADSSSFRLKERRREGDKAEPADPETFRMARVSRSQTRVLDTDPAWSRYLAIGAFVALIMLMFANPWMTINNENAENIVRQAGYSVVFVMAVIAICPWRHPERLLALPWPLWLALAWCWLSLTWAIDPGTGLRRLVLTTVVIWSTFALVRKLGVERMVAILRIMLVAMMVLNYLAVIFYPRVGMHISNDEFSGKWRGLMGHKNFAGPICAMAILFFAFNTGRIRWWVRALVGVAATIFLVMSDSKTSMGICVFALAVGFLFDWLARRRGERQLAPPSLAWALLIVPALIFITMAIDDAPYLAMLTDPAGFTGRTQIWTAMIKAYADHSTLGVGYGSFWDLGNLSPIYKYATQGTDWITTVSEAHDGYLDLLVQIGWIGTLLVLLATLVWPAQRLLYGGTDPARTLGAAIVTFSVGHNFTESQLFDRDSQIQVFLMVALALLWTVTAAPVAGNATAVVKRRQKAKSSRPLKPMQL